MERDQVKQGKKHKCKQRVEVAGESWLDLWPGTMYEEAY